MRVCEIDRLQEDGRYRETVRERVRERVRGRKKEADILYYEELLVTGS